ncbi:hypothetical protein Bbelb_025490 [Branchiostoma belcheri]|nr:hypothetical protein Bbelb_025490 [Branchiostoma belcheri]
MSTFTRERETRPETCIGLLGRTPVASFRNKGKYSATNPRIAGGPGHMLARRVTVCARPPILIAPCDQATNSRIEGGPGSVACPLGPAALSPSVSSKEIPKTAGLSCVCPDSLRRKVSSSAWFKNRFVEDIKIFMNQEDLEESYWKSHLSAYFSLPFGYKPTDKTAAERLIGMLDNPDVFGFHGARQRKPCVRCAVVGTGGVLKGSNKGEEIDAHDYVFRLNHALMQEPFTRDVGKKLSFYISFPESHHKHQMISNSHALHIFIPFKTTDLNFITRWLHNQTLPGCGPTCKRTLNTNLNRTTMKVTHPDFIRYVFANYMNTSLSHRPTTGAMTTFLAIQLCDVVNMYGFGYDPRFPMHYYDHRSIPDQREDGEIKEGAHDYSEERRLWEKLHAENIIFWHSRQNETVETDMA